MTNFKVLYRSQGKEKISRWRAQSYKKGLLKADS